MVTCSKDKVVEVAPSGILFGMVKDSLTSISIPGAAIYPYNLTSIPKFSDSSGYYAFPLTPANGVTIICQKSGYISKSVLCNIVSSESTRADFYLVHSVR